MSEYFDEYDFQTIKRLNAGRINKVLPTSYEDTLSYYETLEKLIYKVEELKKAIEDGGFEESILERANEYTDARVGELRSTVSDELTDMQTEINNFINQIGTEVNNFESEINLAISRLNVAVADLYNTIMQYGETIDNKFVLMYNELIEYIDNEIDARDTVYVIDPVTKKRVPIQTALWSMYNQYMRAYAVTAGEYDGLMLTAETYDNKRLTAYDYDNNFKEKMSEYFNRVMNPFTGYKDTLTNIVMMLVDLHRNCITAGTYDLLGLSADDYDTMDITAYEFDFDNATIFN